MIAIREVEAKIRDDAAAAAKAQAEADAKKFDPSIFQRPKFMSILYYLQDSPTENEKNAFIKYLWGFIEEFGGEHILFLPDEQYCKPLINATTHTKANAAFLNVLTDLPGGWRNREGGINEILQNLNRDQNQGARDAVALFNRYGCQGNVTLQIMKNINIVFNPTPPEQGTVEHLQPKEVCRNHLIAWRQWARTHRAFAVNKSGDCGWSGNLQTIQAARNSAIQSCNSRGGGCQVIEER